MKNDFKLSYKAADQAMVSLSVVNVGWQRCTPGYSWGPGIRDHYLIHYIASGKGFYTVGGQKRTVSAGDAFLIYPNTEIYYEADADEPWTYYWVGFAGTDAGTILDATDFTRKEPVLKNISCGLEFRAALRHINDAFGNGFEDAVSMTGELYLALALLVKHASRPPMSVPDDQEMIRKSINYIDAHYSYPVSIEDIAAFAGVSRSTLFRQFRKTLGLSPKEYLEQYRIRRAKHLLRTTDLTIGSISVSVGYDNGLYFSKVFKKATGRTPSEWRAAHR